jgi:hypothetical protein
VPESDYICPVCHGPVTHIQDWPDEVSGQGGQIVVSLASAVYECPEHGYYRIFISGAHQKVERRKD